ncbi:MAG: hypothetical protein ACKO5F_02230 [Synechococcus sp.]
MESSPSCHGLLAALEERSSERPDRVLRLRGQMPAAGDPPGAMEPFELLIFRGFSSSVSHLTAFDPDQPALPAEARIEAAELLQGPLNPAEERSLQSAPAAAFLDPAAWL